MRKCLSTVVVVLLAGTGCKDNAGSNAPLGSAVGGAASTTAAGAAPSLQAQTTQSTQASAAAGQPMQPTTAGAGQPAQAQTAKNTQGSAAAGPPMQPTTAGASAGSAGGAAMAQAGGSPIAGATAGAGGSAQPTSGDNPGGADDAADAGQVGETTSSSGGGAGGQPVDTRPYPAIQFSGLVSAVELAPVRLAADGIYPAQVTISSGGVDSLFRLNGALVASNAETQALRASVQHPNLRIIFTICEGLYRIVAKRSAGIASLMDLRGKRIAVPSGTSSAYYLEKMLETVGLSARDVSVVSQIPGMRPLTADAATIWEPGIQYVSDNLQDDAIEFQNDAQGNEVYRELFNLHATAESLADPDKRRAIVEFVHALMIASEQIRADPAPAIKLLTGPSGASQTVLEHSMHYERYAGGLVADLLDVLEQEETWRAQQDLRSPRSRSELAMLIDDSIVSEAASM